MISFNYFGYQWAEHFWNVNQDMNIIHGQSFAGIFSHSEIVEQTLNLSNQKFTVAFKEIDTNS